MNYYTGIGSRDISSDVFNAMVEIGKTLAYKGYILRSGGAGGSDTAFETGCDKGNGEKEIYLPWLNFNNNKSELTGDLTNYKEAKEIARKHHPAWEKLSFSIRMIMTRNTYQVLGQDLKTPSRFIICYTNGQGGTMQALRIAKTYNVKVFNLFEDKKIVVNPVKFIKKILIDFK